MIMNVNEPKHLYHFKLYHKVKMILKYMFKPRRVYKCFLVLFLALVLYTVVFKEELSTGENSSVEDLWDVSKIEMLKKKYHVSEHIQNSTSSRNRGLASTQITNNIHQIQSNKNKVPEFNLIQEQLQSSSIQDKNESMKYILLWTPTVTPFDVIRKRGQVPFTSNNCKYTNCFLTHKRRYFSNQNKFDAIVFSIAALKDLRKLPKHGSTTQKFVAASTEPPQRHPVINPILDGYFNWTWTYRLNSDILWRKLKIFRYRNQEVGPRINMTWLKPMIPVVPEMIEYLGRKMKGVVWIKTSCTEQSEQKSYIKELQKELYHHGLSLYIYSECPGYTSCGDVIQCSKMVQRDYYFYLAFEDVIDEDYVTEILLMAVKNLAVPVVLGGADYSRFLHPDSYLDATKLNPKEIAGIINENLEDFNKYIEFFRWTMHYYYEATGLESEVCNICAALNNEEMVNMVTIHDNFRKMWNGKTSQLISDLLLEMIANDESIQGLLQSGNFSGIRKMFKKRHFPDPKDSVYEFDMDKLNITSTEGTYVMPDELTSDIN